MKRIIVLLLTILILLLSACSSKPQENSDFEIGASFYPIYITALNVADGIEGVTVKNMSDGHAGCLHDYQLKTDDVVFVKNCDVFLIGGSGAENFLDKLISQLPDAKIVDTSEGFALIEDNPHVWVSIEGCIYQTEKIAQALIEKDPKNKEAYRKNADAYIEKLQALAKKMHASLDNIENNKIVTMHEAFPYFAKEFSLDIVGVINREPESTPDAKEIKETVDLIKKLGVSAIFAEPQYSKSAADIIANETGAKVYSLDPVTSGENDKNAYINAMEKNLTALEEALK